MGKVRYIGSKARIAERIVGLIGCPAGADAVLLDVFSGTGVVSREAALAGWKIIANDHLLSSALITTAQLVSDQDVPFRRIGSYQEAIELLNGVKGSKGFITSEYTPAGSSTSGHERRYFTVENGKRIDAVRSEIEKWHGTRLITNLERSLLIADLLSAANEVANIAGTYGCFLREWDDNALRPIALAPRDLLKTPNAFEVRQDDCFALGNAVCDVAYIDPPYTKRQYAAYYHILETIAYGDAPTVGGITGLRPWQEKLSPFCYKVRALKALERLLQCLSAPRIVLSYSSEGHMPLSSVEALFRQHGNVKVNSIPDVGRYRPNTKARDNRSHVTEYVIELDRTCEVRRVVA